MIKISRIETYGWPSAIRGMRNSRQSWEKSDSKFSWFDGPNFGVELGPNDLKLASSLAQLGGSHAKFRRMIYVSMDILGPRYWWTEFDTYKIATVTNSTSTMYSIMDKEFEIEDFSIGNIMDSYAGLHLIETVRVLNILRDQYLSESNSSMKKMYWYDVIRTLPQSYNQLRTVSLNYEVVSHMCKERCHHKLDEWHNFCRTMYTELPYAKQLIFYDDLSEVKNNDSINGEEGTEKGESK